MQGLARVIATAFRSRVSPRLLALALATVIAGVALAFIVPSGAGAASSGADFQQAIGHRVVPVQAVYPPAPQSIGSLKADEAIAQQVALRAQLAADHQRHVEHEEHLREVAARAAAKAAEQAALITKTAAPSAAPGASAPSGGSSPAPSGGCSDPSGQLSDSQMIMVWQCAGGPAWADSAMLAVTMCESGHNTHAYNPSGATGLFQILGQVVPGDLFDAHVNALNAVSKFDASGQSWSQWVCRP